MWIPESFVYHDTLRQNLQNFFEILLKNINLFHLQKLLFIFQFDVVTIYATREYQQY